MTYALVIISPLTILRTYENIPDPVVWPNGDASHAVSPGDTRAGAAFVNLVYTPNAPSEFYVIQSTALSINISGDTVTATQTWQALNLDAVKTVLLARIDDMARSILGNMVTPWSGQAMIYYQKLTEAQQIQTDSNPLTANYIMLSAMIGIDGNDLKSVATTVLSAHRQWLSASSDFERKRRGAKAAIKAALTVDAAVAAFNAPGWG